MKYFLLGLFCNLIIVLPLVAHDFVSVGLRNQTQLPMSQVYRVFKDSEGYIWYGTQGGGICRDDGYTVEVFRSDYKTPGLLESNWITCITEDNGQRIWFGTRRGLYILDKKTYQVAKLSDSEIEKWTIDAIQATANGEIWVSAQNLLLRYDSTEKKLGSYSVKWHGESRKTSQIFEDSFHNIWIVQWRGGVFRFDRQKNEFVVYPWNVSVSPTYIVQDSESNDYLISTWGRGIVRFNPHARDESKMFVHQSLGVGENEYSKRHIFELSLDSSHNVLWTLTSDNIYGYSISGKRDFLPVDLSNSLPSGKKLLNQVLSDKQGHLWVACDYPYSFVVSSHPGKNQFNSVPQIEEMAGFPVSPVVFAQTGGSYWFWQRRAGLYHYNPQSEKLVSVSHLSEFIKRKKSPLIERVENGTGIYTILDDISVVQLDYANDKVLGPITIVELPSEERAHILHADKHSNLWIGTSKGLFKCDLRTKQLSSYSSDIGVVNDIVTTSDKSVFLATEAHGLCQAFSDGTIKGFGRNENFSAITIAPNETIWCGTEQGDVYCLDASRQQIVSIKETAGLNGDAILDLEADGYGYIWILTNQRVIIYDPKRQAANVMFGSDPSISMNSFMSLFKDETGRVHVGGMGGFFVYHSYDGFDVVDQNPKVKITSVDVSGEKRLYGLSEHRVELRPHETNVELFFSTLDQLNAGKFRFSFRYKGDDEKWSYLPEGQNSIYLTGLTKGQYVLEIRATDRNGIWSSDTTDVFINRLPAWYETTLAFIVYAILILSISIVSIYIYLEWKRRKFINEQIHNSAMDLQALVGQISEGVLTPSSSEQLNLKSLLLNMKKILQQQREQDNSLKADTLIESDNTTLTATDERFVQKALSFVELNIDDTDYSVEQLSKDLGMDRSGLYRKLVSIIGKTPTSFIQSTRLKRAADLLDEGYTVAETADKVGFGSSSYLSKCFYKEFGVKPSQYINSSTERKKP
jgi:ligand-binding sensor domain-containing protein/AraC-like DNA-binding protein